MDNIIHRNILERITTIRVHFENTMYRECILHDDLIEYRIDTIMNDITSIFENFLDFEYDNYEDVKVVLSNEEFENNVNDYKNKNNKECNICLESMEDSKLAELKCGHIYHTDCIKQWLCNESVKCPICRFDVRNKQ